MKGLIDKSKAAVSGLGDKMKLTAASRAPQENDGFKELVEQCKKYQHQVHDLEEKLRSFVGAAQRLSQMGQSMAESADKVCYTSGLHETAGKSIDTDPMKSTVQSFQERCDRVRADINVLDEEIKALLGHVEERNKAGAHYEKEKGKAEKLESKHDPKASTARQESDRACDHYRQVHEKTLSELQQWKSNAASRYEPIHEEVSAVFASLFGGGGGGSSHGGGATKHVTSAPVAAAAAPAPVKMISPTQPQPIDNYSAPAPAPVAVSSPKAAALPTAIAQWDFNAETPEEVSFKAGDTVELLESIEGEEWKGRVIGGGGERGPPGLFPSAYVKVN